MYRRAVIRPYRPEDEGVLFGLARLERGADEHTLSVLERETVFVAEIEGSHAGYAALVVEPGNVSAVGFYRSRGFVPAGESVLELVLPRT